MLKACNNSKTSDEITLADSPLAVESFLRIIYGQLPFYGKVWKFKWVRLKHATFRDSVYWQTKLHQFTFPPKSLYRFNRIGKQVFCRICNRSWSFTDVQNLWGNGFSETSRKNWFEIRKGMYPQISQHMDKGAKKRAAKFPVFSLYWTFI